MRRGRGRRACGRSRSWPGSPPSTARPRRRPDRRCSCRRARARRSRCGLSGRGCCPAGPARGRTPSRERPPCCSHPDPSCRSATPRPPRRRRPARGRGPCRAAGPSRTASSARPGQRAPRSCCSTAAPGVPDLAAALEAHRPLAARGHDVWAYAQTGSGGSSRLADPRRYIAGMWTDELETVRRRIGADKVVLVGHSYGAYLAARYTAEHPGRVDRLVLTAPGPLPDGLSGSAVQDRLSLADRLRTYRLLARPRALLAFLLTQADPRSARAFAGDSELDARQTRVAAAAAPALHCPGREPSPPAGLGFFASQVPQSRHAPSTPDIRQPLAAADPPRPHRQGAVRLRGLALDLRIRRRAPPRRRRLRPRSRPRDSRGPARPVPRRGRRVPVRPPRPRQCWLRNAPGCTCCRLHRTPSRSA
jgi:pimeloyl-ACP methyl ester carboxylesterase